MTTVNNNRAIRKPDFFIVGAPKSGTTAMYEYLKAHPEIFMCRKEVHFFCSDLSSPWYVRDLNEYLRLFEGVRDEKRVGEASVWYLYSKKAAYEIKEFNPEASIIIMLRNPVDMMYSLHSQGLYNGNEDMEDFEEALNAEEDRKKSSRLPKHYHLREGLYYRDVVRYYEQVKRYIEVFGRERVHIIIFEEFKRDTPKFYRDTLRFLGVDEEFSPEFKIINPNKVVKNKFLRDLIRFPSDTEKKIIKLLIPNKKIRQYIKNWTSNKIIDFRPRPPMSPELRKKLLIEFESEIKKLSDLLGINLAHWWGY